MFKYVLVSWGVWGIPDPTKGRREVSREAALFYMKSPTLRKMRRVSVVVIARYSNYGWPLLTFRMADGEELDQWCSFELH